MLLLIKKTSPGINAHSQQGDSYTFFVRDVVPLARKSGRSNGMSSRCWTAEAMGMQGPQLPGAKLGDSSAWDGGTRSVQHADETIVDSTGQDSRPPKATRAVWTGQAWRRAFCSTSGQGACVKASVCPHEACQSILLLARPLLHQCTPTGSV